MSWKSPCAVFAAGLLAFVSAGQTAHVYSGAAFFVASETIRNQPLVAFACGQPLVPQQAVNLPAFGAPIGGYGVLPVVPGLVPFGGHALSMVTDTEYWSDGVLINTAYHPLYDVGQPVATPLPCPRPRFGCGITTWPCPTPGGFGAVTGMAVREAGGPCPAMLFVTDGVRLMGLSTCPGLLGYTVLQGPCLMPPTVTGAPYTALEVDLVSGFIVASDLAGWSYILTDCSFCPGFFVIPPIPPPAGLPANAQVIGNVLDRSVYQLWVVEVVTNTMWGVFGAPNIPLAPLVPPWPASIPRGASYSAEPTVIQACSGTYSPILIETAEPIVPIAPGFVSLDAPGYPNGNAVLVVSPACTQTIFDCSGCWFWPDFNALGAYISPLVTLDNAGRACHGPLFYGNPIGSDGFAQWVVLDPLCGFVHPWVFSDALHGRLSNP